MKRIRFCSPSIVVLCMQLISCNVHAMTINLAMPWSDGCSRPQTPYLTFYTPQRESLLFDGESVIELRCQAGLRAVQLKWTLHRNLISKPFRTGVAKPQEKGPFPAMLVLPGAGNNARPRPLEHARHDYVVLAPRHHLKQAEIRSTLV